MSDRARSSVRTGTRDGSGTSDVVPEAAAPVDDAAASAATPPANGSSAGGTAASRGATSAGKAAAAPAAGAARDKADAAAAKRPASRAAEAGPAESGPAGAVAAPSGGAAPAAHPVTPLGPTGASGTRSRPADNAARPASAPPAPATGAGRAVGSRGGAPESGQLPIDSTQAVSVPPAARPVDTSRPPAARTAAAAAAGAAAGAAARPSRARSGKGPRRARLQLRHIDTWSALKISLVLSIALFCVWMVAVGILYGVLGQLGVFDTLNDLIGQLGSSSGEEAATDDVINAQIVLGGAAVIGAVNIVLLTALSTVSAFVYNLCSDLVGGLEVTLAERD
ncbi:DUF3566 domain-containing protein [Modestobacter versicolor]|uniref:DUF3566 domain-containing protein n=1 Tax=Modestobacter versicolor TaxID=429133 RepID=UPI0034DE3D1D